MQFFSSLQALLVALVVSGASAAIVNNKNLAASPRVDALTPRQTETEECDLVECIKALAGLPSTIAACTEALKDISEPPKKQKPAKEAASAIDCLFEAALTINDLPKGCGPCV